MQDQAEEAPMYQAPPCGDSSADSPASCRHLGITAFAFEVPTALPYLHSVAS